MTRKNSTPICQDTGTPIFFVKHPAEINPSELTGQIRQAVALATKNSYLRPNAVDSLTGRNSGNNLGDDYFPSIHFSQVEGNTLTIDLNLKKAGAARMSAHNIRCRMTG